MFIDINVEQIYTMKIRLLFIRVYKCSTKIIDRDL